MNTQVFDTYSRYFVRYLKSVNIYTNLVQMGRGATLTHKTIVNKSFHFHVRLHFVNTKRRFASFFQTLRNVYTLMLIGNRLVCSLLTKMLFWVILHQ